MNIYNSVSIILLAFAVIVIAIGHLVGSNEPTPTQCNAPVEYQQPKSLELYNELHHSEHGIMTLHWCSNHGCIPLTKQEVEAMGLKYVE